MILFMVFGVWSSRCKRNMSSKHMFKQMNSWILFGKIPGFKKKTVLIWCVLFWGFSVFRWKITLWWNVVPREDQRLRERGREMKKERTMSERHQVSDWFLLLQKTIGTRMFTQKERRYLCVDWLCWDCRLRYYSSEDAVGNFWMNMLSLGGAHTWYFRTFKLVRIWVHSVYHVVEPHKCHKGFWWGEGIASSLFRLDDRNYTCSSKNLGNIRLLARESLMKI